jgi:hypothetical protein
MSLLIKNIRSIKESTKKIQIRGIIPIQKQSQILNIKYLMKMREN